MSIRSRIGDFLFHVMFPMQSSKMDEMEDALIDAQVMQGRAQEALHLAAHAAEGARQALEAINRIRPAQLHPHQVTESLGG